MIVVDSGILKDSRESKIYEEIESTFILRKGPEPYISESSKTEGREGPGVTYVTEVMVGFGGRIPKEFPHSIRELPFRISFLV